MGTFVAPRSGHGGAFSRGCSDWRWSARGGSQGIWCVRSAVADVTDLRDDQVVVVDGKSFTIGLWLRFLLNAAMRLPLSVRLDVDLLYASRSPVQNVPYVPLPKSVATRYHSKTHNLLVNCKTPVRCAFAAHRTQPLRALLLQLKVRGCIETLHMGASGRAAGRDQSHVRKRAFQRKDLG